MDGRWRWTRTAAASRAERAPSSRAPLGRSAATASAEGCAWPQRYRPGPMARVACAWPQRMRFSHFIAHAAADTCFRCRQSRDRPGGRRHRPRGRHGRACADGPVPGRHGSARACRAAEWRSAMAPTRSPTARRCVYQQKGMDLRLKVVPCEDVPFASETVGAVQCRSGGRPCSTTPSASARRSRTWIGPRSMPGNARRVCPRLADGPRTAGVSACHGSARQGGWGLERVPSQVAAGAGAPGPSTAPSSAANFPKNSSASLREVACIRRPPSVAILPPTSALAV